MQAQVSLLRALLDYQPALINFEALQQAPAVNSATTTRPTGASLVPLPVPRGIARQGSATS